MSDVNDEQRAWVLRVLGVATAPSPGIGGLSDEVMEALDLEERMRQATLQMQAMKEAGDPALPKLLAAFGAANTAFQGRHASTPSLLDTLESELGLALSAARGRGIEDVTKGAVAYGKLLLRWRLAERTVKGNLIAFGKAFLAHPDVISDPDFEQARELVAELPDLVPDFGGELDDVLDAATKPGADLERLNEEALGILDKYRDLVDAAEELQELEPFVKEEKIGDFRFFSEFVSAFDDIEESLIEAI